MNTSEKNSHWVVPFILSGYYKDVGFSLLFHFAERKNLMSVQMVNKKEGINLYTAVQMW